MYFCLKQERKKQQNMKTSQNHNHGLAKFSPLHLTSKNCNTSSPSTSKQAESMSKYFTSHKSSKQGADQNSSTCTTSECFDSPYKNALTEIKYNPSNNDPADDFKTPKLVRKTVKAFHPNISLNKQKKSRKFKVNSSTKFSRNGNYILKITKDNFGQSDVNPDHLQLALALSKSMYSAENPEKSKDTDEKDFPTILSPRKVGKVKTTLERYGFKSDKPKLCPEQKINILETSKRSRYSKFRYVTPTLKTRTDEERESIISSKISLIMCQNKNSQIKESPNENENELFSDLLKKFHYKNNIILMPNRLSLKETNNFSYYNKSLNISPTKYRCGCLLKKWDEIPGREKSPELKNAKDMNQDCSIVLDKCKDIEETDVRDINMKFQKCSKRYEFKTAETDVGLISAYSNYSEFNHNLSNEGVSSRNCISPDLFESDCEINCTSTTSENEDIVSQSPLTLSDTRKRDILNSTGSESVPQSNDCEIETLDKSWCNTFKSDTGIKHFESYYDDVENLSQQIYFLNQSSEDADNKDIDTEKLYINLEKDYEKPVVYDLTQSSSSNEDTSDSLKNKINNKELLHLYDQTYDDIDSQLTDEKYKQIIFDITQSSSSNEDTSDDFKNKANEIENLNHKSQTDTINSKLIDEKYPTSPLLEEIGTNLDTFPLQIRNSADCGEVSDSRGETKDPIEPLDFDLGNMETLGMELNSFYSTKLLNVTHYVNQILNKDNSSMEQGNISENSEDSQQDCEIILSQGSCSQESIVISDEELNYSSIHSTNTKNNKSFYDLPDTDELDENCIGDGSIEEINNAHAALKNKYSKREISVPVHSHITELKNKSSLTKKSLAKAFLEDSFNDILEDTNILNAIETEAENDNTRRIEFANSKACSDREKIENPENKSENLEKIVLPTSNNIVTPDNKLIIKTENITPMVNYEEMDTPKIANELQKFGVKPLKRQRGIKLLKYLYECTHPLVGPDGIEELSSDEDDQRVFKKRKKINSNTDYNKLDPTLQEHKVLEDFTQNRENVLVEDLLENETLDNLIFERKYSTKIPSCRVPLQIIWHNFVSNNPEIKKNILLYEPLQLEVVHSMLKEQSGFKFHIQDLLTFLDRKCVTIRTAQAQGSRRKVKS